jgi:uncharacterized membrane-anchored protein YhcB (DUF1043 family)
MYYNNEKCEILAEFGESCVIRFEAEAYYDEGCDPVPVTIIVPKKFVSKEAIKLKPIMKEHRKLIKEFEKERQVIQSKSEQELNQKKREIEEEIKDLEKQVSKFSGVLELYKFLKHDYKYVVFYRDYGTYGIVPVDELIYKDGYKTKLRAISYQSEEIQKNRKTKGALYVEHSSDGSGSSRYKCRPAENLEEAKQIFLEIISNDKFDVSERIITECDKWEIRSKRKEKTGNDI